MVVLKENLMSAALPMCDLERVAGGTEKTALKTKRPSQHPQTPRVRDLQLREVLIRYVCSYHMCL